MRQKLSIILVISLFFGSLSNAQDKSNRGKEFWLGYGFHWLFLNPDITPVNSQELALYISSEQAATVTVSVNGTAWTQTVNIPANTVDATILIPKTGPNDARLLTDGFSNKGIHIVSDVPVAVYAHVYVNQGSGATMLMPVETYGYSYSSVNYRQNTSGSSLPNISPTTQNGPDSPAIPQKMGGCRAKPIRSISTKVKYIVYMVRWYPAIARHGLPVRI